MIHDDKGKLEGVYVRDSNFDEGQLMAKPND
jgi:glycine/D-amino acid oxidase-like deaminating enzyme